MCIFLRLLMNFNIFDATNLCFGITNFRFGVIYYCLFITN